MGPITDLISTKVPYVGLGNLYIRLLGYIVIQVQVEGVQGYDEDQIALVILDFPILQPKPQSSWEHLLSAEWLM